MNELREEIATLIYAVMPNGKDDLTDAYRATDQILALPALRQAGWQDIGTAPTNGEHFLAYCIDLVDEYDEDDRLLARQVPTPTTVIAYSLFGSTDFVQYPWTGSMPRGRRYVCWQPLPQPPEGERP